MYPLAKKRSVSLTAEKQSGEKKRKIMLDADVRNTFWIITAPLIK